LRCFNGAKSRPKEKKEYKDRLEPIYFF